MWGSFGLLCYALLRRSRQRAVALNSAEAGNRQMAETVMYECLCPRTAMGTAGKSQSRVANHVRPKLDLKLNRFLLYPEYA